MLVHDRTESRKLGDCMGEVRQCTEAEEKLFNIYRMHGIFVLLQPEYERKATFHFCGTINLILTRKNNRLDITVVLNTHCNI